MKTDKDLLELAAKAAGYNIKAHSEFFKGLSPREEYAKHAELRKTIDEF